MKKQILRNVLMFLCLLGVLPAAAAFKDIKIDLTDGNLLTADEISNKTLVKFGVAIADDGTATRVAADDATAAIVLSGKYHSNEHGWGNFSATVAVDGPVKVSMGTCAWGGDVTVKDAAGNSQTFNTNTGACYHNNKTDNIASTIYKGTSSTTLTISGGSYTPYIAVEAIDPSTLSSEYTVTFNMGAVEAEGVAPESFKVEEGKTFTVPANKTLYIAGKTLKSWTDGTTVYAVGSEVTCNADMTLTPVFEDNAVSLSARTEPVTLLWDFQRKNGAPTMAYQGNTGIFVTQATVAGEVIDVKMDMDATSGKVNNGAWTDWCQWNSGTKFTIPSCKGAEVTLTAMSNFGQSGKTATTIDGQSDYTPANPLIYTIGSTSETIDIVIGNDGGYYRTVQTVLPVVKSDKQSFDNTDASAVFPMAGTIDDAAQTTPDGAFTLTSVAYGSNLTSVTSGTAFGYTYTRFQPTAKGGAENDENAVEFKVVPSKGVTFTPTKVSANIARFGTDGGQMSVRVKNVEGKEQTLATGIKPRRNNKTEGDVVSIEYEVPSGFNTTDGFSLLVNIYDNAGKQYGLNNVCIYGTVNGEKEEVAKYTVSAICNPEEAGTITVYPNGTEFDEGTELKLTATKNFGYKFVNWTDSTGAEVATENVFNVTLDGNKKFTANFQKLNTYSLDLTVQTPGNSYMVAIDPAPTQVDNKNMYEEGTKVTLTASSNKIVTFSSWSNGETSTELQLDMTENKSLTANYDAALDFIAGWDFVLSGSNGRKADFSAEDNDADALVLRDEDGNTSSWLDKCQSSGGYEGKNAAVNWRTTGLGKYYWQTQVNASAFKDLKVSSAMAYNYNAYTKYDVEYSIDGTEWSKVGTIAIEGAKNWKTEEFALPSAADNQPAVYIRWKADTTSPIDGTTSDNDGIAISEIFIYGTAKVIDDGKAPALLTTVPENGAQNASANGSIVLTFDEKVKLVGDNVVATLGEQTLTPSVSGKTVMFSYKGLDYNTEYTFSLPANSIADLTDNALTEAVNITFKTKTRPVITKSLYDFVVPDDGTLNEALKAAAKRADTSVRYRIFVKRGDYKLPADEKLTKKGSDGVSYPDPTTYLNTPNVSIIGEDCEGVAVTNTLPDVYTSSGSHVLEGIGQGDVLSLQSGASNTYFQDITFKSSMGDAKGRDIVLNDGSNKTVCKNVCLWGYQDTYVSNSNKSKFYFEGGLLRGRTDFLCGKGDVFYNGVTLQMCAAGYLAVPSVPTKYGYIFRDCTIQAENESEKNVIAGKYTLGRPWGSGTPIALYINTTMKVVPSAEGWAEMSGGWPKQFAEYNSVTDKGTSISLESRKTVFGDGTHTPNNPKLTKEEADFYTIENVLGGSENWDPTSLTEQASAPKDVVISEGKLTWTDSPYVLLYAICKNGNVVDFTTENYYDKADATNTWSVRAANEMGGLGEATVAGTATAVKELDNNVSEISAKYYSLDGVQVDKNYKATVIKVVMMSDGSVKTIKINRK